MAKTVRPVQPAGLPLPKLVGPSGDFAVAEFDLLLAIIFFVRRCVPVHKFVVSIIPADRLFCVVAANRWCIHHAELITASVRALFGVHPHLHLRTKTYHLFQPQP
jgi:hypothetical protein